MLVIEHLDKRYPLPGRLLRPVMRVAAREPVDALRDVTFEVGPGEIVGLLGPNGAGKTTLIRIVATLLTPSAGRVSVAGSDVERAPEEARKHVGLVLDGDRGLYMRLTGQRNLEFFGALQKLPRDVARARADELLSRLDLRGRDKLVFGYSAGMRARLCLARALIGEPRLLVLDEPTRSLDPAASRDVGEMLRSLADDGRSILLSSHRLDEVRAVCDRVVVLNEGGVRHVGAAADVDVEVVAPRGDDA